MSLPATLSVTNTVVALLAALLTARISAGPGWHELRYFAWAALAAALYSFASIPVTLDVDAGTALWASRVAYAAAGLHSCAWLRYLAAQEERPLTAFERTLVIIGLVASAASLVPGVAASGVVDRRVAWPAVVYRDGIATPVGEAFMAYYCIVLSYLAARYVRQRQRGAPAATAHIVGLAILALCALNDALAASHVSSMPYLLDAGFTVLVLSVGVAVTAQFVANARALEQSTTRLAETQRELVVRERLAAIGELSAVVAHEVRNPLAVIFNAVAGLKKLTLGERERVLTSILEEEAGRLNRIVAELLEFARPRQTSPAVVEIEPLVLRAVDAAKQATHKDEPVDVHVARDLETMRCDPDLLRQAIINLVANALVATGRTTPVKVDVDAEHDGAEAAIAIRVSDDGDGIPESNVDRIFLPFFTTRPTGTGLGLPIVRRVAEAHGGSVSHEPSSARGATFVLRVPLGRERASGKART